MENRLKTKSLVQIGLFSALIAISSWISVPAPVPFTLQTMAIFLSVGLLGGKRGTMSVVLYILLGAVGLPVFSGFKGGLGVLFGLTGGYILGFLISTLEMWAAEKLFGKGKLVFLFSMVFGLFLCYLFGTAWFLLVYTKTKGAISLISVLSMCVFPFLVPDGLKIALAYFLTKKLKKHIKN